MSEQPLSDPPEHGLHELAQILRRADHLEPDMQRKLADLVDELAGALSAAPAPASIHLAESAAHLAHALQQQHDDGLLATARRRLESSALRAEREVPLAAGIIHRLLDTLANLGI